jgi:hypothetical protein
VQAKDLPTGLVVGHSGSVVVAQAAEAVGLGGDDRGRDARTDARLLRTSASHSPRASPLSPEPTGVLAKLAAVEAGDVGSPMLVMDWPRCAATRRRRGERGGLVPAKHTGVAVAGKLDLDGEGALALEDCHSSHGGALIDPLYRIAPG